jgi:octopine/nopaline transport system permease protein
MDLGFVFTSFMELLSGLPMTLNLTFTAFAASLCMAIGLTAMRRSQVAVLSWIARIYVFILRGTPLLVQMFLIYYGLGQYQSTLRSLGLWQLFREPYWCAILALAMNNAAYGSEVLRGALQSVPRREVEAARAFGMSGLLLYRRIIIPIAVRQALPAYGNELILMVKATSLTSTITLMDVTGIAAQLIATSYKPVEVFIAAGTIYLLLNFLLTRIVGLLDWWLTPHLRDRARTIESRQRR